MSLKCLDQSGDDAEETADCDADTKYCVIKHVVDEIGDWNMERDCADEDMMKLKNFYSNISSFDEACIWCKPENDCKNDENDEGNMDDNEIICFFKTDKCNDCKYGPSGCKDKDVAFDPNFPEKRVKVGFCSFEICRKPEEKLKSTTKGVDETGGNDVVTASLTLVSIMQFRSFL